MVTQTVPKAGYAVQFVSLEESPTEYDNIPGHLVFARNQPIYVWNESGEADAKLWFEDSEGRAWMEGWIGHASEKPLYRGDGGFGEGLDGFQTGIFPADLVVRHQ